MADEDDLYLPLDITPAGRLCQEYVREDWGADALLIPCGRAAWGRTGLCEAHYSRARRKSRMDRPFGAVPRSSDEVRFRDELGRKRCNKCQQFLPESEYQPRIDASDGLQHRCQLCTNLTRYGLDRNSIEGLLAQQHGRCANPGCATEIRIFTRGEDGQNGRWRPRRSGDVSLACVDHDHSCCPGTESCGRCIRGLLCWHCNSAAGLLGDDAVKIGSLAEYLVQKAPSNGLR